MRGRYISGLFLMSDANGRCDDCGRFMKLDDNPEATWGDVYDFVAMCCDHVHYRCPKCTKQLGPARSNARPYNGDMRPYEGTFA